ncbi:hypothetical protein AAFN86_28225 [Roseomonas sp. CAU 1739]|uniref:hypothetical protein n=1 Tax=Roseomonas sp. CAU 1739 TaxID=3140364 RepID=UPI00325A446D
MDNVHIGPAPLTDRLMRATEQASDADRRWFAENPGRSHRMRRPMFGEVPAHPDFLTFVLVKQVQPGFRVRTAIYADTPPPGEADEASAAWLWNSAMASQGVPNG